MSLIKTIRDKLKLLFINKIQLLSDFQNLLGQCEARIELINEKLKNEDYFINGYKDKISELSFEYESSKSEEINKSLLDLKENLKKAHNAYNGLRINRSILQEECNKYNQVIMDLINNKPITIDSFNYMNKLLDESDDLPLD